MVNNNTKVWIFIFSSSLLLLIGGYQLGDRLGLLIGLLIAISLNFFAFAYGENKALKSLKAYRLEGQDAYGLNTLVQKVANDLRLPLPRLYLIPSPSVNALSLGQTWKKSAIALTEGMTQRFSQAELTAVVAFQVIHLQNYNRFSFNIISTVANAIMGGAKFLDRLLPRNVQFFVIILNPWCELLMRPLISKSCFLETDEATSRYLGERQTLGEVLWKLDSLARTRPLSPPPCSRYLFMVNPDQITTVQSFFGSHPQTPDRLKKLVGYYPL